MKGGWGFRVNLRTIAGNAGSLAVSQPVGTNVADAPGSAESGRKKYSVTGHQLEQHHSYQADPTTFIRRWKLALEEVGDFSGLQGESWGAMLGRPTKARGSVWKQQKSLFSAYAKALVEVEISPYRFRALEMFLKSNDRYLGGPWWSPSSSGNSYPVIYSMYLNTKREKWLLENMIVNGINVGLAFPRSL